MQLFIDLQVASANKNALPSLEIIEKWLLEAILKGSKTTRFEAELTVRIVDSAEIQQLNVQYRHKDKPTNVLSFPFNAPQGINLPLLGDIVICKQIVEQEALEQQKDLNAHWAHLLIHGSLHLLGYDHIIEQQALEMEDLETQILVKLGFPPPYNETE
ncbi:rRNA maturation RNase YbeY [Psychromonas sp. CD1]|uniref:rRNA maturation RNase YbeY n=1 Tax=Psychromonas sp. CD1 TaxID=1979839 RepID=UPI000B9AFB36|nr:rRNA maturation RNase YbeY [Psychromonas sp. CD1]